MRTRPRSPHKEPRDPHAPWRFLLGGLFGIMGAFFALHILYTMEARRTIDLLRLWRNGETIAHDVTAVVGFFVASIIAMEYVALRDRCRTQSTLARALREDNARKNQLLTIASRELQTPVTAFRWGTNALLEKKFGPISAPQEQHLQGMQEQLTTVQKITRDLLDIAKLELDTLTLTLRPLRCGDLTRTIQLALQDVARIAEAKRVHWTVTMAIADALPVQADTTRIVRVAEILAENAVQYTPTDGQITIAFRTDGGGFAVDITDTGIGIPLAEQPQVFAQFFRGTHARTSQPSGSGIGLYLAKQYIDRHGGTVGFSSTEGKGSTFTFSLPIRTHIPTELEEVLGRL